MNRHLMTTGSALAVAIALVATPGPAVASPTTEVVQGRVLRLVSVADWNAATSLLPGQPVQWDVTVSAETSEPGTITIGVSARGEAPLVIDARLCPQAWQADECPGGARVLETGWSVPRDGTIIPLADIADSDVGHLRILVRLDADGSGTTDIRVHAQGVGDAVVAGPGGTLPATGGAAAPWIIGAGAVLAGFGVLLAMLRERRGSGNKQSAGARGGG